MRSLFFSSWTLSLSDRKVFINVTRSKLGKLERAIFKNRKRYHVENLHRNLFFKDLLLDGDETLKVLAIWSSDFFDVTWKPRGAIHSTKIPTGPTGKTFSVGPNRSTEFWTESSRILVELIAPLKNKNGWDDFWFCKGWCWMWKDWRRVIHNTAIKPCKQTDQT